MTSINKGVLEAIKTPLGIFSVILLIIDTSLCGLALATSGSDRTFLIYSIVGLLGLIILIVVLIGVYRPEAFWGKRALPIETVFIDSIASDVYIGLNAIFQNFTNKIDQEEAWITIIDMIASRPPGYPDNYYMFREDLSNALKRKANVTEKIMREHIDITSGTVTVVK